MTGDKILFTPAGMVAMLRAELGVEELVCDESDVQGAEPPATPETPKAESEGDHAGDL